MTDKTKNKEKIKLIEGLSEVLKKHGKTISEKQFDILYALHTSKLKRVIEIVKCDLREDDDKK